MNQRKNTARLSWWTRARRYEIGDIHAGPMADMYQSCVDRVDERINASVKNSEFSDRLHLHPYRQGLWVSLQTGHTYRGNGGSERDEWHFEQQGPWVLVDENDADRLIDSSCLEYADERAADLQKFVEGIGESISRKLQD